jgi:hypothetical protein
MRAIRLLQLEDLQQAIIGVPGEPGYDHFYAN